MTVSAYVFSDICTYPNALMLIGHKSCSPGLVACKLFQQQKKGCFTRWYTGYDQSGARTALKQAVLGISNVDFKFLS